MNLSPSVLIIYLCCKRRDLIRRKEETKKRPRRRRRRNMFNSIHISRQGSWTSTPSITRDPRRCLMVLLLRRRWRQSLAARMRSTNSARSSPWWHQTTRRGRNNPPTKGNRFVKVASSESRVVWRLIKAQGSSNEIFSFSFLFKLSIDWIE